MNPLASRLTPTRRTGPAAVASATASPTSPIEVSMTWSAATWDAAVMRDRITQYGDSAGTVKARCTPWSALGLLSDPTSSYRVSAWDAAGNCLAPSEPATTTTPTPAAIAVPAEAHVQPESPGNNDATATARRLDGSLARRHYLWTRVGTEQVIARTPLEGYPQNKQTAELRGQRHPDPNREAVDVGQCARAGTGCCPCGPRERREHVCERVEPGVDEQATSAGRLGWLARRAGARFAREGCARHARSLPMTLWRLR